MALVSCEDKKQDSKKMEITYPTTQTVDHVDNYHVQMYQIHTAG